MTVIEAVIARLSEISELTAIVSDRIYGMVLPQNVTLPATVVQDISQSWDRLHLRGPEGIVRTRVQIDHYASTDGGNDGLGQVQQMATATKGRMESGSPAGPTGLHGWTGEIGSPPFKVIVANLDDRNVEALKDEFNEARIRQDFLIRWRDS